MANEILYFYIISTKIGLISIEEYNQWLNEIFLNDKSDNEIILELEFCSYDINKTIDTLNLYLYDELPKLNYNIIGKMIVEKFEEKYYENTDNLEELTYKLYKFWKCLPQDILYQEPFLTMCYIDDLWDYPGEDEVLDKVKWLINYYKN